MISLLASAVELCMKLMIQFDLLPLAHESFRMVDEGWSKLSLYVIEQKIIIPSTAKQTTMQQIINQVIKQSSNQTHK